ncbi:2-dehydro-3-deoxygalactonokinase [Oricola sp.]|uniref:2-dehydro-3-deoxygalactonokinase n=1 Tax=Oricola sp. TaxID=1979950 RepID=UPI003512F460
MTHSAAPSLVAVDWGTSHLRVWLLDADGAVLAEHRSSEGMGATAREQFQSVLEAHLAALTVPADVPVVMCGMVGSRQGWAEARYLTVPVSLADVAAAAVRIPDVIRDIRIMPGLSKPDRQSPDVMRGEETQLLGLSRLAPSAGERFVCMPGTHSKWVRMRGDSVIDFVSFLTGDAFAALSHHSVLRHSLSGASVDPESAAFRDAVRASLETPADIFARVFSIRAAGLLQDLDPAAAAARLSGYLIGQEIAGAKARFTVPGHVDLIGDPRLGALYTEALVIAGMSCTLHDSDTAVIAGLAGALSAPPKTGTDG